MKFIRSDSGVLVSVEKIETIAPLEAGRWVVTTPGGKYIVSHEQISPLLDDEKITYITRETDAEKIDL